MLSLYITKTEVYSDGKVLCLRQGRNIRSERFPFQPQDRENLEAQRKKG